MNPKTAQVLFRILLETGKTIIGILENKHNNGRKENNHAPEKNQNRKP